MNRFLGLQPELTIRQVRDREPEWFKLAESVAAYAGDLIYQLQVPRGDQRLLLGTVLYRRVASAFEAVIMLAERGMHTEGLAARRSMIEALFMLGAICNQTELVNTYLKHDEHRLLKIYKNIKKMSPKIRKSLAPELSLEIVNKHISELIASTKGSEYMSVERYAQAAKLHDIYLTDYSFLSEAAHHTARDLERQIAVDAHGDVNGFYWGSEPDPPSALLSPAIDHMLMAARATEALFKIGPSERLGSLWRKAEEMFEQHAGTQDS